MPELLDLFSGAQGAGVGYARAGFRVTSYDLVEHAKAPGIAEFEVGDALDLLADTQFLDRFDVVHTSPPCPRYSVSRHATGRGDDHPDLVGPVRDLLRRWGGTYVIENVPGAPMPEAVLVCGAAMGLVSIRRHRLFESNALLMTPGCACDAQGSVSVFGHSGEDRRKATRVKHGHVRKHVPIDEVRRLMGVEWMTDRSDVSDAIPPAYTQYLGEQLIDRLGRG